jgi:folate-binding protein YgfZ
MQNFITPLINYGFIEVLGKDALTYLQGQVTNDMKKVSSVGELGCLCNVQGRVQALFRVFKTEEGYVLRLTQELIENALARLKKYAIFSKVTIQDVSEKWQAFGIKTDNILVIDKFKFFSKLSDNLYEDYHNITSPFEHTTSPLEGEIGQASAWAGEGYVDINHWNYERIKLMIPEIYSTSYEKFLPHHLNIDKLGGISFDKGCYTGQEIIARMHYKGTLKQHLNLAKISIGQSISPNTNILNPQKNTVGHVVDSTKNPENHQEQLLLTLLRDDAKNEKLMIGDGLHVIQL